MRQVKNYLTRRAIFLEFSHVLVMFDVTWRVFRGRRQDVDVRIAARIVDYNIMFTVRYVNTILHV